MKIVICWSNYTGYWASCWRHLASIPGVDLFVLAFKEPDHSPFDQSLLEGVPHRLLDEHEREDSHLIKRLIADFNPDIIQVVGWFVPAYRDVVKASKFARAKKVMSVDTPYRTVLQLATRLRYREYFKNIDGVGVTGERSWQYVRRLGFNRAAIRRHMYGVDEELADRTRALRSTIADKRRFLFVGRYAPEKGIEVLIDAYSRYRKHVDDPWELICCGGGELAKLVRGVEGVVDMGFVAPRDIANEFARSGAYVISSRFDPWPLVIVEAALAGLPIIASDACGSAVEVVRPSYNGFITATGDPVDLSSAMVEMHNAPIDEWGERSRSHALPFTSKLWAKRWHEFFQVQLQSEIRRGRGKRG